MIKRRDDFPQKVKDILKRRVGGRCSAPHCRVPTEAAHSSNSLTVVNIGKAAHICAAAPGGPRYDMNMTSDQRMSIDNGIWLCANHADEIDRDDAKYTIDLLEKWKLDAERHAIQELGRSLPHKEDAANLLVTALTGMPVKSCISNAIQNVIFASEKAYENLDPRFSVRASVLNGLPVFEFNAKEEVTTQFKITNIHKNKFKADFSRFIDYAEDIEIPLDQITVEGSPLIEGIVNEKSNGVIVLSKKEIPQKCVLKIWSVDNKTKLINYLDDFQGKIVFGKKIIIFTGTTFDGLISASVKCELEKKENLHLTIFYDFDKWNGLSVSSLPYFKKSFDFLKSVIKGGLVNVILEVNGELLFSAKKTNSIQSFSSYYHYHKYIDSSRIISDYFSTFIKYDKNSIIDEDTYDLVNTYAKIINGDNERPYLKTEGDVKFDVLVSEDNIDLFRKLHTISSRSVSLSQSAIQNVIVFGQNIELPGFKYTFTKVRLKLGVSHVIIDDYCSIYLTPTGKCRYIVNLIN